jgi:uncharacterized protein (TIRG00374 family)
MLEQLRRRLMLGVFLGVAVVLAVVIISDAGALARALRDFDWRLLPLVILLTLVNYALRYGKWEYYLRLLGVDGLARRDSLLIFVAGFTMVMTPGKVGELLKSYLVRTRTGTPIAKTAPVIAAERLTDGVAMLILAGIGLIAFRHGWQVLVAGAILAALGILLVQHEPTMARVLGCVQRTRIGRTRAEAIGHLYASTRSLLRPRPFAIAVTIGVVSWFCECLAFYLVLIGLGLPQSWTLLLAAMFVFAASAWIGGASLLPGGLGAAEASVAGLLLLTVDDPLMTSSLAATATLLIRFATLWFGVLLGVAALARVARWAGDRDGPGSDTLSSPATANPAHGME